MKLKFTLFFFCVAFQLFAFSSDSLFTPHIEGTIRAKYEYNTSLSEQRFQVRNARFSVNGNFSKLVSYKAEIDLSDEGETKMLDAYLRFQPLEWFRFTVGQQKIPFSTDNLRSPHQLFFANRSFIGKQLTGLRDVGATLVLSNRKFIPVEFTAGLYNGTGLYDQQRWRETEDLSYALRAVVTPHKFLSISLNYNSVHPYDIRMNMYNVGGAIDYGGFHIESELYYKTYQDSVFKPTMGFFVMGAYSFKTEKLKYIKKITPVLRYDNMSNNNKGQKSVYGTYVIDDYVRSRVTGGLTFSLSKPFMNDIRLNYEYYTFPSVLANHDNKLVLEFVVRF